MCNHLISIKNPKTGEYVQVPCGHCISCLVDMQTEWATRLTIELKSNLLRPAVFVTLTYNDDNLPCHEINEDTGEEFSKPCCVKQHVQQFMRSLRNNIERQKKKKTWKGWSGSIKYFFTSEYGPENGRPHYHGIIFGLTKDDLPLIEKIWNKGFCHVGDCNEKTITYCSKYCIKPVEVQRNPNRNGYFDNEKWMEFNGIRRKPFRLMSTSLGKAYFEDEANLRFHFRRIFEHNYIRVGNHKKKMPRYFKQKIYTEENLKKFGNRKEFINLLRQIHKYDKKYYGNSYIYYNLINGLGRLQYYRHLASDIKGISLSEDYFKRVDQSARQREDLLIQNRIKWYRRHNRYHQQ